VPHRPARPYLDPYLAGVGLGVVLLLTFVLVGQGLGASGAFASVVASGAAALAPEHAAANPAYAAYAPAGATSFLREWLFWEIIGVFAGGALSAWLFGRFRRTVERGPRVTDRARLLLAFGGGAIMGVGAKLARGCTSGQALSGGAVLSVGSWLFIAGAFGAAYLAAPLFRRQWI
jgi:uncharacterized membrane protein YedE/YeeE